MNTCKNSILFNSLFFLLISFFSCKKEEKRVMMVRNDSISNISYTSAQAYATIIDPGEGIEQHGHCWSDNAESITIDTENKTEIGIADNTGSYNSIINNLTPGQSYYVRAYVKNGSDVVYGVDIIPFTTLSISYPVVTTGTVTNITTSKATVSATLNSLGTGASSVTDHGHCWSSETATPTIENSSSSSFGTKDTTGNYQSTIVGLSRNTLYFVRAYAENNAGTSYGDTISFTTNAEFPIISTSAITSITDTSAVSGGNISDDGGAQVTARGVCWSTSENPTILDLYSNDGSGTGSFISNITDLNNDTKYYIRAYATNSSGTSYGNQVSFTTGQKITSPVVATTEVTSITESSAQSGGTITSDGGAPVTARGVCWSTSTNNPDIYDFCTSNGSGTGLFISNITGLSPGTAYNVRAYATNSAGTGYGLNQSFTTKLIEWQKSLGGSENDIANSIQQTSDGGYIVAGYSESDDGNVSGNKGQNDHWIVKLTTAGDITWQKSFGGSGRDEANSIQQTSDGGYIIAGHCDINDGDVSGNHGGADYWIVKLTSTGNLDWQKSLGGSVYDEAFSIQQTTDGGYIIAGFVCSADGDVTGIHGGSDFWIAKLTSTGDLDWQKTLGGSLDDRAYSIQLTTDGGYIIAGWSWSNDGDVSGNHGGDDYWILKLTSTGDIDWQKSLGGSGADKAFSIQQTTDGGYIVAGVTESNDGDVTENHGESDCWIVKLTSTGDIVWQNSLGGSGVDEAYSIQQTTDGGYIVAGITESNDGDVSGNHGASDYWIVKIDSTGEIVWQNSLGGSWEDEAFSIQQTTDGNYIIAGWSESIDGDVSGNQGGLDFWIVKIYDK